MSVLINSTTLGNMIIVTGSFLLLLFLIKKFAWRQITGIFDARAEKIAADIDGAEKSRQKADQLKEKREYQLSHAREEAGQIIETAKHTGKAEGDKIIQEAHQEANRQVTQAKQAIQQHQEEALTSIKGEVADLTVRLAEKILSNQLNATEQSKLIDNYLDTLGES